jgi:CRP-like cAMP-binding protein
MAQKKLTGPLTLNVEKDQMLCAAGDTENDLFIIHSGKIMVFVNDGTKVTPIAYLGPGEYLGELSFFDNQPRSAHAIAIEASSLIRIPVSEIDRQFPRWLITIAQSITGKIRGADELIRKKGIRRQNVESIKPLTIDEQRHFYKILSEYQKL